MVLCDFHTHSHFSFDGVAEASPDAVCRRALEAGLSYIAITDHCDVNGEVEGIYAPYEAHTAWEAMMQAKEKYKGRLHLSIGIELGNAHQYPNYAKEVLSRHPYDFVIGSLHNLRDVPDFCMLKYELMTDAQIRQLFGRMLNETMEMLSFDGIHTLGHITYMHRYLTLAQKTFDFKPFREQITDIYRKLIDKGVALELNVSTLYKGLGITLPTMELLSWYKDVGGQLITIGSDAHNPQNIGKGIRKGYALLSTVGFDYVMAMEGGKPTMIPIQP